MGMLEDTTIYTTTIYNEDLIVTGGTDETGQLLSNGIARWNGSQWQTMTPLKPGSVITSLANWDGSLIMAGLLYVPGQDSVQYIARWDD